MMKLLQRAKNQDEEGLSLIEMVIAIVVFAIVALSAYPIFLRSVEMVSDNNLTTAASVTINKMLEDIRDTPNCATLAKYSGAKDYKDNRNVGYTVSLSLKDKCEPGSVESFDIKAVKTSTSKSLLEQRVQVLVPPRNGVIELKK